MAWLCLWSCSRRHLPRESLNTVHRATMMRARGNNLNKVGDSSRCNRPQGGGVHARCTLRALPAMIFIQREQVKLCVSVGVDSLLVGVARMQSSTMLSACSVVGNCSDLNS